MVERVLEIVPTPEEPFFQAQVAALRQQDVTVDVVSPPGRRVVDGDGVDSRTPLDYASFLGRVLRRSDGAYDLVHANYGLTAPFGLTHVHRPVVVSLWGSDLHGPAWVRYLSRASARAADAVVVMSDEMRREVGGDAYVLPHGVDTDVFRPRPREEARARLGWSADAYNVLFPYAPSRPVKNYPLAVEVCERADEYLDAPVDLHVVYGESHDRMPTYYNAADALLLTSRYEGSPNTVKEAMACNLPVVATDVGDVRERLDGVTPSAVCETDADLVDALVTVLSADERSNGAAHVADFDWGRMADRLLGVYCDVVEDGVRGGARSGQVNA